MRSVHELLGTAPFDIYELHLFQFVAVSGSFTKAAQQAGLTQSAITRQIQGIEDRLGTKLFERTTRRVILTAAGRFLLQRAESILREVGQTLQQLREDYAEAPKSIAVGVSRSVGLAYLPGFFVSYRKKYPEVRTHVVQKPSEEILAAIESNELQVGIVCLPPRLPAGLKVTHRFDDEFTIIAPPGAAAPKGGKSTGKLLQSLADRDWLLLAPHSNTGRLLRAWLTKLDAKLEPAMEAESFDLIVNLVAMGMGYSIVPHRSLPLYPRTRAILRIPVRPRFARELAVVIRKDRSPPAHVTQFVENVLF
jgi:DNA-binding transcriptional LysR family regulator